jgi:hypothetical protein
VQGSDPSRLMGAVVMGPNRVRVSEFGAAIVGELRRASLRYRGGLGEAARQLAVGGSTTGVPPQPWADGGAGA